MLNDAHRLAGRGCRETRALALRIAAAGLAAADPGPAVRDLVEYDGKFVTINGVGYELHERSRVLVLGAGKATRSIAASLEDVLGDRIDDGVIVLPQGDSADVKRIRVLYAEHPVPGSGSVRGAEAVMDLARSAGRDDLVLACITGGSSALLCAPPCHVSLADKAALNTLLLRSGAEITEINAVRKHVSRIKGGRLARLTAPARVINLSVSDVATDALDAITDPTVPDTTTVHDAADVLSRYGLWQRVPVSVRMHLTRHHEALADEVDALRVQTELVVSGRGVCDAMVAAAKALDLTVVSLGVTLDGLASDNGRRVATTLREKCQDRSRLALVACGGESRVSLPDRAELSAGGPNQEAALSAALALAPDKNAATVFLDTDGSDGGTPWAGAIVDSQTERRAAELALSIEAALESHESTRLLHRLDDLIATGPTGTNVNDLVVGVAA